jgi:hypothetical protein
MFLTAAIVCLLLKQDHDSRDQWFCPKELSFTIVKRRNQIHNFNGPTTIIRKESISYGMQQPASTCHLDPPSLAVSAKILLAATPYPEQARRKPKSVSRRSALSMKKRYMGDRS